MGDEVIGSLFVVGVYVMFATVPGFAVGGTQGLCRMTLAVSLMLSHLNHILFFLGELGFDILELGPGSLFFGDEGFCTLLGFYCYGFWHRLRFAAFFFWF